MMQKKRLFTPLGIDHIVIACYDRHFWRRALKKIGFKDYHAEGDDSRLLEQMYGATLVFGRVKFFLVDSSTALYSPKTIYEFLARHGDMQIFSVAIAVDNTMAAWDELVKSRFQPTMLANPFNNGTGERSVVKFCLPHASPFSWELVECREPLESNHAGSEQGPLAVDHFAIAVSDLESWKKVYRKLGFKTIYKPETRIEGKYSGMETVAMQRGGWAVALVEGVDRERHSQVTTYVALHGEHSVQHVALRFQNLSSFLEECRRRHVQFRVLRNGVVEGGAKIEDILHRGRDQNGELLQCFTKPLKQRVGWRGDVIYSGGGIFFEFTERISNNGAMKNKKEQAFYGPTVRGLYESIEDEEEARDQEVILPQSVLYNVPFDPRITSLLKKT